MISKYSVAVIATMSAGKSSLLNALMGVDLLPSQNEACTATVFKVTDHDELGHFIGRYHCVGEDWTEWREVDKDTLRTWNLQAPQEIELKGNIPNIANTPDGVHLCFIDTPGPNNAMCKDHSLITQQVIAGNDFSTLIFVINASVAGVKDEYKLLFALKSQLEKRQSNAQVIFALNKIDLLDTERGESLFQTVKSIRHYLEKEIGFENPMVVPVCGRLAADIRFAIASHRRLTVRQVAHLQGKKLTGDKLRNLPRRKRSRLHYLSLLPLRLQKEISNLLEQFRGMNGEYENALALNGSNLSTMSAYDIPTPTRQVWIGGKFYTYRELFELELLTGVPCIENIIAKQLATFKPDDENASESEPLQFIPQFAVQDDTRDESDSACEEDLQLPQAKPLAPVITAPAITENTIITTNPKEKSEMLQIGLTYNPYLVTTQITVDGQALPSEHKLCVMSTGRLQNWIDNFLPALYEEYRETNLCIEFTGTEYDWKDVISAIKKFNDEKGCHFTASPHLSNVNEDRIKKIIALYNEGLESPFKEIFDSDEMRAAFARAVDPTFEANVIATMSSGKSTVVNALLGKELMPAKNEACTATLARITDDDSMVGQGFLAQRFDREGKELSKEVTATREILTEWNDDPQTHLITMRGDIPTIRQTDSVTFVLTDTPGPNNARSAAHERATLEAIQSKPLSMVIYVLNATQLSTNDDDSLLRRVCTEMSKGGRQAHDRFVFIANKIDAFDPEKGESVKSALQHVRAYLRDHGIINPIIIPASAQLTKLLRLPKETLTRSERGNLNTQVELFTQEPEMNMLEHSRNQLSAACAARLDKRLQEASNAQDINAVAEILSGIPIVEELLNDFLQKHAIPAKLKDAVDTFNQVMQQSVIAGAMNEQLVKSEEELNQIVSSIKHFIKDKENINRAKEFRKKVESLKYEISEGTEDKISGLMDESEELIENMTELFNDEKATPEKAKHVVEDVLHRCQSLEAQVNVELNNALKTEYVDVIEKLRNEYQEYAASVIKQNFPENESMQNLQKATMTMPTVAEMVMDASHVESVKTGTKKEKVGTKRVAAGTKRVLAGKQRVCVGQERYVSGYRTERYGFLWLKKREVPEYSWRDKYELQDVYKDEVIYEDQDVYEERDVMEERKFVDLQAIRRKVTKAIREFSQENINRFRQNALENVDQAKKTLLKLMEQIDNRVAEVSKQLEEATASQKEKERLVEENRKKVEWFTNFKAKVEDVLTV